jgi:hypothetical protein
MPNETILQENVRSPIDGTEFVRLATPGTNWKATLASIIAQLGTGQTTGISSFATPAAAQSGTIADSASFVKVEGFKTPGDGGAATYQRVNSLPSLYVGDGSTIPFVPPSFTSGGFPVLCFSTTTTNQATIGPSSAPILAGCLTFAVIFLWQNASPPASFTDSAGNVYLLATTVPPGFSVAALYYCANPVFAPVGTTFSVPVSGGTRAVSIYCVPGFTGAVLDQTAILQDTTDPSTGITITTGALTASPQFVIGAVWDGGSPVFTTAGPTYTQPAGWTDITPPTSGNNPVACIVTNNTNPVTYHPTWLSHGSPPFGSGPIGFVATFKTFPKPALDASFWSLMPSFPLHTAAFGIDPTAPDNVTPFRTFGRYFGKIAQASGGVGAERAGTPQTGTVTISIANPAVITVSPPWFQNHGLHAGQMISFQTTGLLPTGIVANQIYFIQYGTVTPTTFQISTSPLFDPLVGVSGGSATVPKGTSVVTSGSQSGTHSYTTYGQSWNDFVLDPGIYAASQNQFLGLGTGIQKWRCFGYGARIETNADIFGSCGNDINAATGGSTFAYSTQFQTTSEVHTSGNFPNSITLVTAAKAANFYPNSWVALMAIEQQASADGNWNPAIFEYVKVQSADPGTGIITFWDRIQYNYRSTYPQFKSQSFALTGASDGPATIVQFSDAFDQEIEIYGVSFYGVTEETVGGVYSIRMIDCDIYGWAFDSGPSPVFVRRFEMQNCRFHNCVPELDKMIDTMVYVDCDFDQTSFLRWQSASINKAVVDRCKMMGGLSGTPKDLTIRDSYIAGTFTYGPVYGSTQRMTLINTHIERILNNDQASTVVILGTAGANSFVNGTIKFASGVTGIYGTWNGPNTVSVCPAPWAQPGAKMIIEVSANITTSGNVNPTTGGGTCGMVATFTVLDVYTDGPGSFCIDTDMAALPNMAVTATGTIAGTTLTVTSFSPVNANLLIGSSVVGGTLPGGTIITADHGGLPGTNTGTFTLSGSPPANAAPTAYTVTPTLNFLPHPCPRLTMVNCTGGRFATDMAGAPPDIPMFSYFKRAYSGQVLATAFHDSDLNLAGNLLSWTINVIRPYTGAGANYICLISIGGFATSGGITYPTFIQQTIDLKTAGLRTITAAGVSGSVGADSIAAIPFWISGKHNVIIGISPTFVPNGGDTLANMPHFIMQAQTDQGLAASMTTNTSTSGVETLADTTTQAAQPF